MYKIAPYALLLMAAVVLQIFIFDRMLISSAVAPLVYISFIVLLPIRISQLRMMAWGVVLGLLFDLAMGIAGINTIATVLVSFMRIYILKLIVGDDLAILDGIPTGSRLRSERFIFYVSLMVLLHSIVFFTLEFLNFSELGFLLRRIIFSSCVTIIFITLLAGIFDHIFSSKR